MTLPHDKARRRGHSRPPRIQATTLWHHPSQQHGDEPLGIPGYEGRTPTYVIWNLLQRYTQPGDLVVDPFCGGGTTLDVAKELGRESRGFDLRPMRADIELADARDLPLEDASVDFLFMDPPWSSHLDYSDDPRCIGKLDAFQAGYMDALGRVFREAERVLADGSFLAILVSDTFKKKKGFVPIGARVSGLLERRFRAVDHVAVVRGSNKLEDVRYRKAAEEGNFFLRGFNHLLIFQKGEAEVGGEKAPVP